MLSSASTFVVNSVVFIESLAPGEMKTGRWVEESLAAEFDAMPLDHHYVPVGNAKELLEVLAELRGHAERGMRPIIQIDAHGDGEKTGLVLQPSGEVVEWQVLADALRPINAATGNNLNVILALCFGFHGILPVSIKDVTPFLHLVGPEGVENAGPIREGMAEFYRRLFRDGSIESGMEALPGSFRLFYAEKMLTISFLRYLVVGTRGKGRAERIERLLSEVADGRPEVDVNAVRKQLRKFLKPENANFDGFKERFLMSDHPDNVGRFGITLEDCLRVIDSLDAATVAEIRSNAGT